MFCIGLYEPFRRLLNQGAGLPYTERRLATTIGAGTCTGIVGGKQIIYATIGSLVINWSPFATAFLGNPLFLVKARMQVSAYPSSLLWKYILSYSEFFIVIDWSPILPTDTGLFTITTRGHTKILSVRSSCTPQYPLYRRIQGPLSRRESGNVPYLNGHIGSNAYLFLR
jgi:hypothetical protein